MKISEAIGHLLGLLVKEGDLDLVVQGDDYRLSELSYFYPEKGEYVYISPGLPWVSEEDE